MKVTQVSNCEAWGNVVGMHPKFPRLIYVDSLTYNRIWPGMLVTSLDGQKHTDRTGHLGLGIVLGVKKHPRPRGSIRFMCTVLWNFTPGE